MANSLVQTHKTLSDTDERQILRSRCLLAEVHAALGNYATAEQELEVVVGMAHVVNGKTHPETLRYESLLALVKMYAGKFAQAFKLARDILPTQYSTCLAYTTKKGCGGKRHVDAVTANLSMVKETETQQVNFLEKCIDFVIKLFEGKIINPSVIIGLGVLGLAGSGIFDSVGWQNTRKRVIMAIWVVLMTPPAIGPPLLSLVYKIDVSLCIQELSDQGREETDFEETEWRLKTTYDDRCRVLGRNDPLTIISKRDLIVIRYNISQTWQGPDMGASDAVGMDDGGGALVVAGLKGSSPRMKPNLEKPILRLSCLS